MDSGAYEEVLRAFHAELARAKPAGFISSTTYRFGDVDYSDWYLVRDSSALDVLNVAAVSGARSAPHDSAARMAAAGTGKLMSLAQGEADLEALHEAGFAKPGGMSYSELYEMTQALTSKPGVALWRRMMVLGPPPEFRIVSREPLTLSAEFAAEVRIRGNI